jgi:hypothetical protein
MTALLLGGELASRFLHIPFSSMGVLIGATSIPPFAIPVFVGALMNRYVLPRFVGRERWEKHKPVIAAGIATGQGIATGIGIALLLISKATWIKPW